MGGNKLLPLLAAMGLAVVVMVGFKSLARKSPPATAMSEVPKAPAPDADSPADTVRTLTAQVADMKSQAEALRRQNEALLQQRTDIALQVGNQIRDDLRREQLDQRDNAYEQLAHRIESLADRVSAAANAPPPAPSPAPPTASVGSVPLFGSDGLHWVEPLDNASLTGKAGAALSGVAERVQQAGGSLLHGGLDAAGSNPLASHVGFEPGGGTSPQQPPKVPPEPAYTVPRNATLIGSTGMTALIGRIPIKGQVDDPYPFKVIVGRDNLAANGLDMPDLDGMIFAGTAIGDWALSCVRGTVHSVTYLFQDGTIRTLSSDDQSLQQKTQQNAEASGQPATTSGSAASKALGWISDRRGIPCISGERISNASSYLLGRMLAAAIGAAGQAFARAQTTVTTSPLTGGSTGVVTGNPYDFAIGQTGSGAGQELADWLKERQSQSFDVVYADTGTELAIHVDKELPIDYEPKGRRLAYDRVQATQTAADHSGSGLD